MSKLDSVLPKNGQSYKDVFEVHTLSSGEPDVECIHLTPLGKQQMKDLMLGIISDAYPGFNSVPEGEDEVDWYNDQLKKKVNEL